MFGRKRKIEKIREQMAERKRTENVKPPEPIRHIAKSVITDLNNHKAWKQYYNKRSSPMSLNELVSDKYTLLYGWHMAPIVLLKDSYYRFNKSECETLYNAIASCVDRIIQDEIDADLLKLQSIFGKEAQ